MQREWEDTVESSSQLIMDKSPSVHSDLEDTKYILHQFTRQFRSEVEASEQMTQTVMQQSSQSQNEALMTAIQNLFQQSSR
jgi:hypothetical protein